MKRWRHLRAGLVLMLAVATAGAQNQQPKRINKAIDLLSQGQPIWYDGGHGGYEEGVRMAQTWATTDQNARKGAMIPSRA